jgi:acyl carrier protein
MITNADCTNLGRDVIWLIADTFDADISRVTPGTRPGEIDGWDSLGHSVLLGRLERKLGFRVNEEIAAPIENVGELIKRLSALRGVAANG